MNKHFHKLSHRLTLGIILMAVPVFVLSLGIFFVYSRNIIHKKAGEYANNILIGTSQRIVNQMNAVENAANSNAWLFEESFTPDSIQSISYRMVARNRSVLSCSVGVEPGVFPQKGRYFSVFTVNEGDTIYTTCEPEYEYFNKMWYKQARSTGKPCWINPFSDYVEAMLNHNEAVASYSIPLHSSDGRVIGVMATDFSFTSLSKLLTSLKPPYPSAYYMLLGADGRYLIHPKSSIIFKKTIFSDADANENSELIALGHEMTAGKNGTMHVTIDGEYCHVSYAVVPGTDWSLALVIHADEMLGPYNHLAYIIVVLIVVCLFFIFLLCQRTVSDTIAPINQLLDMTEKIANGQYNEVIPLSPRKDAVAQLQNSFAAMQKSIVTHMTEIEQTAKTLDQYTVEQDEQLKQAEESVEKKNQFLNSVLNHLLRPLNVIKESTSELRDSFPIPKHVLEEISQKLHFHVNFLVRMVRMLYDSSDTRASDKTMYERKDKVLCNQMARDCISYAQEYFAGLKICLETDVPDDFHVQSNHLYVMRTIRELLYNSAKYSDGEHILLRVAETENTVQFIIEDVGTALPDDMQDQLFKPFTKVDNMSEGFGLGLPLCKRHANGLGGNLIYDSNYKEGCRFIFELPK